MIALFVTDAWHTTKTFIGVADNLITGICMITSYIDAKNKRNKGMPKGYNSTIEIKHLSNDDKRSLKINKQTQGREINFVIDECELNTILPI